MPLLLRLVINLKDDMIKVSDYSLVLDHNLSSGLSND